MTDAQSATVGDTIILEPYTDALPLDSAVEIFPAMDSDQRAALRADISENGVREPVLLFDGAVADGRHRYELSRELGLTCPATEFSGTRQELMARLMSANFHRRHLTASQRATIAVAMRERHGIDLPTETLGKMAGVSGSYVRKAQRLRDESPQHFERVAAGELTLPGAASEARPPRQTDAPMADDAPAPSPSEQRDCLGHSIPLDVIPVFAELESASEMERTAAKLKRASKEFSETTAGVFIDKASWNADLKNWISELKAKKPYTLCPGCQGEGCQKCEHNGWMGESRFLRLPADVRERWTALGQASLAERN